MMMTMMRAEQRDDCGKLGGGHGLSCGFSEPIIRTNDHEEDGVMPDDTDPESDVHDNDDDGDDDVDDDDEDDDDENDDDDDGVEDNDDGGDYYDEYDDDNDDDVSNAAKIQ